MVYFSYKNTKKSGVFAKRGGGRSIPLSPSSDDHGFLL